MPCLAKTRACLPVIHQINQLEKDKDVVAQAQAIATLEMLPQLPFSVVNALNGILTDSKVGIFCICIFLFDGKKSSFLSDFSFV